MSNLDLNQVFKVNELKILLRDYHLCRTILNIVSSAISDVISKSSFELSIEGMTKNEVKVTNEIFQKLSLRDSILTHLDDIIYYGSYAFHFQINKDKDEVTAIELANTTNITMAKSFTGNKFYVFEKPQQTNFSSEPLDNEDPGKTNQFVSENDVFALLLSPKSVGSKPFENNYHSKDDKKNAVFEAVPSALRDQITRAKYFKGTGFFDGILFLVFEHLIKSLMRLLLSVKETLKSNILQATLQDEATANPDVTNIMNAVEDIINDNESSIDLRTMDPMAVINTIYARVLNNTKVVPGLQNFSSFEMLKYPDLAGLIGQLGDDLEKLQKKISTSLGVPEEIIEGSGNRWETIARSSRFLTMIESIVSDISTSVKETAKNIIKKKFNKDVLLDDIKVNLDSGNIISNNNVNSKMQLVGNKISAVVGILRDADTMLESKFMKRDQVASYVKKQLSIVDESLEPILEDVVKEKPIESSDTSSSSSSSFGRRGSRSDMPE